MQTPDGQQESQSFNLGDPHFAPPPITLSKPKNLIQAQFMAEEIGQLPSFDKVLHSGEILCRIWSVVSFFRKKWMSCFWICYEYHSLYLFQNKSKFDEWMCNPYLSDSERKKLVYFHINFEDSEDMNLKHMVGYKCTGIKMKWYPSRGLIHHFKLDRWYTYGPSIVAAFGSESESDIIEFHTIMNHIMMKHPKNAELSRIIDDTISEVSSGRSPRSNKSAPVVILGKGLPWDPSDSESEGSNNNNDDAEGFNQNGIDDKKKNHWKGRRFSSKSF